MTWALSLCAALTLLATGCASVGDFCHSDDDCGSGLRCTATGGARGVCTYPGGTPDLAAAQDLRPPDIRGADSAPADSAPDVVEPDLAEPDLAEPDAGKPDAGKPDASKPDALAPDLFAPDSATLDAAQPDSGSSG